MKLKSEAGSKLNELFSNVRIPSRLFLDNAGEETSGEWDTVHCKHVILLIPQVRLAHNYPISPWEMIHPPGGDNPVRI
jgi:hypothetical protein